MFKKHSEKIQLLLLQNQEKKVFIYIFCLSLFCLYSLFQANTLYLDDYWRLVDGNQGWEFNARPLGTVITVLIQLGRPFTDISPFTQIISIAIYSLGIIYLGRLFQINNLSLFIIAGAITIINPYNLSIYTFVLDSLTITCGIFFAILSLYIASISLETRKKQSQWFVLRYFLSILLLTISLCFYQTGISVYFTGFLFFLLIQLCDTKNYLESIINFFIFNSILAFSLMSYIPIKNLYKLDEYTLKSSRLPEINNLTTTIPQNIFKSWEMVKYHLSNNIMIPLINFLLLLVIIVIIINLVNLNKCNKFSWSRCFFSILLAFFYYVLIITSFIFPSYMLANPPWHPRIFLGFTVIIGFSCLFLIDRLSKFKNQFIKYIFIFYLSLILLSFANLSLTYGNVLHNKNLYEERIGTLIINDVETASNQYNLSLSQPKITFINSEKVNSLRRNKLNIKALEKYPIMNSLAYPYFTGDDFGITKLETFGINFERISNQEFLSKNQGTYIPTNKALITRQLYDIYLEKNDIFIIYFKE